MEQARIAILLPIGFLAGYMLADYVDEPRLVPALLSLSIAILSAALAVALVFRFTRVKRQGE